jgi:1,4-dihydroxy-6-naphthoate synthase
VELAVPGRLTTAFLVLRMCLGEFRYREVAFDAIIEEVRSGRADAGLLIHEGQLTYEAEGLKKYALRFGRGLDTELVDRFVGMYVNELTCDYGEEGRQAVRELLGRAEALGAYDQPVKVDFVG